MFDQTKSAIRRSRLAASGLPGLPGFSRPLVGRSACTRAQSSDQRAGRHTFLSNTTHMDRRRHALQTHAQNASARTHDLCGHAADAIVWMPRHRRHTLVLETASRRTHCRDCSRAPVPILSGSPNTRRCRGSCEHGCCGQSSVPVMFQVWGRARQLRGTRPSPPLAVTDSRLISRPIG